MKGIKGKLDEIVRNNIREVLKESNLNRVLDWMNAHDIACVTAFRDEFKNATPRTLDDRPQELIDADKEKGVEDSLDKTPYSYSKKEKLARNRKLKASLLSLGYGVTNIHGNYIENYGTIDAVELGENSFFVVNLKDDENFKEHIFELSEYYNQDCFLYKPKGSEEAYNIGTNYGEYPGYGEVDGLGKLHININSEFLSRVGNSSFSFSGSDDIRNDNRHYDFNTRKKNRSDLFAEALNLNVYEDYSRGSRMSIKAIHESVGRDIATMKKKNF